MTFTFEEGAAQRLLRRVRLERTIRDIEEEIDLQMRQIGELLYGTYKGRPSDSDDIQTILAYIDSLYEELEGHRGEVEKIKG